MPGPFRPSRTAIAALAALLLLAGCASSRTPIPSEPQRTTEADGRKARQEREAADLKTAQAAAAQAAAAKEAAARQAAPKQADEAQAKSAEAAAPASEKVEPAQVIAPSADAPKAESAKAEPTKVKVVKVEPGKAEAAPSGDPLAKADATAPEATKPEAAKTEAAKTEAAKTDPAAAEAAPKAPLYYVQMGSFTSDKNAEGAVAWLRANGFESSRVVKVEQGGGAAGTAPTTLHRVQAGPFQDLVAAHKALDGLKINWPQAFIPAD